VREISTFAGRDGTDDEPYEHQQPDDTDQVCLLG